MPTASSATFSSRSPAWPSNCKDGRSREAGARLDDGQFEIVVYDEGPLLETIANAPRLFLGTIGRARRYRRLVAREAVVTTERPVEHHRDGEPEPVASRFEIALLPRSLPILVPRETAEDPLGPFVPETR